MRPPSARSSPSSSRVLTGRPANGSIGRASIAASSSRRDSTPRAARPGRNSPGRLHRTSAPSARGGLVALVLGARRRKGRHPCPGGLPCVGSPTAGEAGVRGPGDAPGKGAGKPREQCTMRRNPTNGVATNAIHDLARHASIRLPTRNFTDSRLRTRIGEFFAPGAGRRGRHERRPMSMCPLPGSIAASATVGIVPGAVVDRHSSMGRRDERCVC